MTLETPPLYRTDVRTETNSSGEMSTGSISLDSSRRRASPRGAQTGYRARHGRQCRSRGFQRTLLAPAAIEWETRAARVGEQWTTTLYVAGYPDCPKDGDLSGLFDLTDVEFDLTVDLTPKNLRRAREHSRTRRTTCRPRPISISRTVELDEAAMGETFDEVSVSEDRFGQAETDYKEWAIERLREHHTTTVEYTGDNNVTYTKECTPKLSDVSVHSID